MLGAVGWGMFSEQFYRFIILASAFPHALVSGFKAGVPVGEASSGVFTWTLGPETLVPHPNPAPYAGILFE